MKSIIFSLLAVLGLQFAYSQPPAGDAKPGDAYGATIRAEKMIDIRHIPAMLDKKDSFPATVKATVLEVCPNKGCWLKLAVNDTTTAFVKMKDYGFFLPSAIKGKTIVLEGEVKLVTTPVSELRHYATDAGKPQSEIDAITQPKKEIRFTASGIRIIK